MEQTDEMAESTVIPQPFYVKSKEDPAAVAAVIPPASPNPDTDMDLNVADDDDTTVLYRDAASSSSTADV